MIDIQLRFHSIGENAMSALPFIFFGTVSLLRVGAVRLYQELSVLRCFAWHFLLPSQAALLLTVFVLCETTIVNTGSHRSKVIQVLRESITQYIHTHTSRIRIRSGWHGPS